MVKRQVYYSVHGLKDGTICFAFPGRKPRKTKYAGEPMIDQDGIHTWYFEKDDDVNRYSDWGKSVWHTCVSMGLNVRRIIRQQVESKLVQAEQRDRDILERLERIEEKLDQVLTARKAPAKP